MYDVYGIGNALVDIEFEVTPVHLAELGIDKGVMTLVDSDRQQTVMQQLSDCTRHRACGGSAANSIIAVRQLGGGAFYSCRVADDDVGTFYLRDLSEHGVHTNVADGNREAGVTGTCLVFVTPDADRTMNTHLGISAELGTGDLVAEALAAARYLYVEGYLASSDSARAAVIEARGIAREAGTRVALTLSDPNMVEFFRSGLEEMIDAGVELLFANEVEACMLAGTDSLAAAVDTLKSVADEFVVTRGADGALVYDGSDIVSVPGKRVDAIDTVGAGDMFAGTFLYGICRGMQYADAAAMAVATSAQLVTSYGPRLGDAQMRRILREHESG